MYNNFRDKNLTYTRESKPEIHISKELCEKRILERFPVLNNDRTFHNLFTSYDFHANEN